MGLVTSDDVKDKAPDRKAFAAAKKVGKVDKWTQLGKKDKILWGSAVASSGDPYSVFVDLGAEALECSCPSRKRPCKHALGLLLLEAADHDFPESAPPSGHQYEAQERYYSSWE